MESPVLHQLAVQLKDDTGRDVYVLVTLVDGVQHVAVSGDLGFLPVVRLASALDHHPQPVSRGVDALDSVRRPRALYARHVPQRPQLLRTSRPIVALAPPVLVDGRDQVHDLRRQQLGGYRAIVERAHVTPIYAT